MAVLLCGIAQINAATIDLGSWTSTNHEDNSVSEETFTFTLSTEGTLLFDWFVSSEGNYDWLRVYLDDMTILEVSGVDSGTFMNESLSSGVHTLVVQYSKDSSQSNGDDQASVTNICVSGVIEEIGEVSVNGLSYILLDDGTATVSALTDAAMTAVVIPSTITVGGVEYAVTSISSGAFQFNENIVSVVIPESMTSISRNLFAGCTGLTSFTIPASVNRIGNGAFDDCTALKEIIIADGYNSLSLGYNGYGQCLFYDCPLETLHLGRNLEYNTDYEYGYSPFSGKDSLTSVVIGDWVTTIPRHAFRGCDSIASIVIPESVTLIDECAFYNCTNLEEVTILGALEHLGDYAFQYCTSLETLTIAEGLSSIGTAAISHCAMLKNFTIPSSVQTIGEYAFDYSGMESITIPSNVWQIGYRAFSGCANLKEVVIADSYNSLQVGDGAFSGCPLEALYLGRGIENDPFSNNATLTSVVIGSCVTSIDNYFFESCTNLESVTLGEGVTSIGRNAFNETNVKALELPAGVYYIGYNAFSEVTSKLTCNATTPPSVDGLRNVAVVYVPEGCKSVYKSVDPWASRVIVDGSGVAVDVTVTPGLMGEEILNHVNYLSDVNYLTIRGAINETDINNIKNSMPNLLTIDMSGLDMKQIPNDMFWDRKALLSLVLPNNVESIGCYSFHNCINLENLVLPEGLKKIENGSQSIRLNGTYYYDVGSFSGCSSLNSVSFPSTLESIGDFAFYNCSHLRNIELKEGLTDIGRWAFANCRLLNDLALPNSLRNISAGAFKGCYSLREVVIPEGVVSIGSNYEGSYVDWDDNGAFENCSSLEIVELSSGLEKICQRTFYNCGSLNHVEVPEGVTYIGRHAFYNCTSLTEVVLPSTLNSIGSTPFAGCNQLTSVSCLSLLPPTLSDGLLTLDDMGLAVQRTLYVPEWTLNRYKLSSGWAAFSEILPIVGVYPSTINILGDAILTLPTAGFPAEYKPEMNIVSTYSDWGDYVPSSLVMRGGGEISLDKFTIESYISQYSERSQLLNDVEMTADNVEAKLDISSSRWHFLSFPFDVKISDVTTEADWVVRKYDGQARAEGDYYNTWVNVPYDDVLHAGQGYIWYCSGGQMIVPAMDNENKNLMFANTTQNVPLQEYATETTTTSDRSWNLVGNPFPCYYDTRKMDYTAPITVWKDNTYAAYSPVDDDYVLAPFEAFFVQQPAGVSFISFDPDGRQLSSVAEAVASAPAKSRAFESSRQVINLTLSNERGTDRTRIVLNNEAKMDYELSCDAAKFMSDDNGVPQLYSIADKERFAINERPVGDGVVKLGTRFGTKGTYTIAMQSTDAKAVILVDLMTGVETDLTTGDYTFDAEASDSQRFEIRMYADENVTLVESVAVDAKVLASGNAIVVTASGNADVEIYNASGCLIATGQGGYLTFDVAQGVYVVKVNGVSYKVVVVK